MAKSTRPTKRRATRTRKAGAAGGGVDPLVQRTLDAVKEQARMTGVSPIQYVRGVMTGRYPRLSPRELGED
jgi:hypothetical protein